MSYLIFSETAGIPFIDHIDRVPPDRIKAKTSFYGFEEVELDSKAFLKNPLITAGEILNIKPQMCTI